MTFFLARLDADTFLVASLWVLDYFVYYPLFLYLLVSLYAWYDAGFPLKDKRKDKPKTFLEWTLRKLERVNFYAFLTMMLLLCFQLFIWVNPDGYYLGGVISLLIILTYLTLSVFVQEWARQGFYLPPIVIATMELLCKAVSAVCVVVAVVAPVNPMFALSIAYCAAMLWQVRHRYALLPFLLLIFIALCAVILVQWMIPSFHPLRSYSHPPFPLTPLILLLFTSPPFTFPSLSPPSSPSPLSLPSLPLSLSSSLSPSIPHLLPLSPLSLPSIPLSPLSLTSSLFRLRRSPSGSPPSAPTHSSTSPPSCCPHMPSTLPPVTLRTRPSNTPSHNTHPLVICILS